MLIRVVTFDGGGAGGGVADGKKEEEEKREEKEDEEGGEEKRDIEQAEDVEIGGVVDVFINSLRQIRSLLVG